MTSDPVPRKRRKHVANDVLAGSGGDFMEGRGIRVIPPPWSTIEELIFKECAFRVTATGAMDISLLEKMYNSAVKKYCNGTNLSSIRSANSSKLESIPRERSSKEIQSMLSRMQKEDKVFRVIFTSQIKLNFETPVKHT